MNIINALHPLFITSAVFVIAIIFIKAGISKLHRDNQSFYIHTVKNYEIFPTQWAPFLLFLIGLMEVLSGLFLFIPPLKFVGLALVALLLTAYTLVFLKQIIQGKKDIACGCLGPNANLNISPALLIRNVVLLSITVLAFFINIEYVSVHFLILVVLVTAVLGLVYISVEGLIENTQRIQKLRNTH